MREAPRLTDEQQVIEIPLSKDIISETSSWTYGDITIMVPAFLIAVECLGISVVLCWAFNPRSYFLENLHSRMSSESPNISPSYHGGFMGMKALIDAAWMWDPFKHCFLAFTLLPSVSSLERRYISNLQMTSVCRGRRRRSLRITQSTLIPTR